MYEVYDINTGETIMRHHKRAYCVEIAKGMNQGKLDKLYAVRSPQD
jgi:hypothetical protein